MIQLVNFKARLSRLMTDRVSLASCLISVGDALLSGGRSSQRCPAWPARLSFAPIAEAKLLTINLWSLVLRYDLSARIDKTIFFEV